MIKTILVTGSSGTVGTALVQELEKQNYRVIPLDIKSNPWDKKIDRKTVRLDLRKSLKKTDIRAKVDLIIHLAANARVHELVVKPKQSLDNYLMTYNVLEYARLNSVPGVLFSSSREVYGESQTGKRRREIDTHVSRIKSPYTASKYSAEALIHAYRECYDIKTVIVRLSNVYGRFDVSERVIPLFIYYALRNRPITVFGKEKKLDFTYTDDCVDGLCRIVKSFDSVNGLTFNISRGKGERLYDLARMIVAETESKSTISFTSKRTGEISSYTGDIALAKTKLGYKPRTDLKDGLKYNIEWYLKALKSPKIYQMHRRYLKHWGWE